jgi:hypothetical protein
MTGSGTTPPARPDAPIGAARPGRRWLPTGIVALVMSVTVLGGFVTADALPEPDVRALSIGGVVTLTPLPGWEVVRREEATLPSPAGGTLDAAFVQLTRGSGVLDGLAIPGFGRGPEELAVFYAQEVLRSQLERLSVSDRLESLTLPSGLTAVRFGYIGTEPQVGTAIEGSVTVVVAQSGNGAVFDGWGSKGQLELVAGELAAMIESAELR